MYDRTSLLWYPFYLPRLGGNLAYTHHLTHYNVPAVSLPKIAKPELTTIPILGDDNIPAPAVEASAPTKPDAAAPGTSTDKEAAAMEEDHEVISLVAFSVEFGGLLVCSCLRWACAALQSIPSRPELPAT